MEAKGSHTEDKKSSFFSSSWDSTSVRASRETRFSTDLGVGGEEGGFSAGKKMQSFNTLVDGISSGDIDPRYETQLGREIKPILCSANIPREISTSLGLEVEGEGDTRAERNVSLEEESLVKTEGTWLVSLGRVWQIYPKSQENVDLRPGQACSAD